MIFPQLSDNFKDSVTATIKTNKGEIELVLFPEQAPQTVKNFIGLAQDGKYDDVIFHRVIKDFMIQGGDPTGTGFGGESYFGHAFPDEFSDVLFNFNGALSMANSGPNTNGSQFFIVSAKAVPKQLVQQMKDLGWPADVISTYEQKGGTPWLDGKHTVFGQVISEMDIVDEIEQVETDGNDKPINDIVIENITFKNLGEDQ